jgi:DNA-binding NarL/FixJ family response regulator
LRPGSKLEFLTEREREVLRRWRGATNREIAGALFVAEGWSRRGRQHLGKLGVRDRVAAIVVAYNHGVGTPQ